MRSGSWLVLVALLACSAGQKRAVVEKAVEPEESRRELFEATLRVLDEHPEYVDEFFELAVSKHPETLGRFVEDTAARLEDRRLAERTAAALARHPEGLQQILVRTLDASAGRPEARRAIGSAIASRPERAARVLSENPRAAASVFGAFARDATASALDVVRRILAPSGEPHGDEPRSDTR
jgi:hypothetical protein